jgi:hypothetical protein
VTGLDALRKATTSFDDEPCDQKEGSCLVAGAVESDRDVTGSGTFFPNKNGTILYFVFPRNTKIYKNFVLNFDV